MKDNYFNEFIAPSLRNQVLFRKPTFDEVYEMSMNKKSLICEDVFKLNIFEKFYDKIKNTNQIIECFDTEDLKDYFPIKSKIFKALCKNKNLNFYKLYVIKIDYENFKFENFLKNIIKSNKIQNTYQKNHLLDIFKMMKNDKALFTYNKQNKEFGIIWINENNFSLDDIKHEFIHYYEWIKNNYLKYNKKEESLKFENSDYFLKIFNVNEDIFDYIFDRNEYQTLLNEFLDILNKIKNKFFSNLSEYEFAKMIDYDLFKHDLKFKNTIINIQSNDNSNIEYLNKLKNLQYFKDLFENESFGPLMIVGYNCLNYKIINIKNHVYGYFNKK